MTTRRHWRGRVAHRALYARKHHNLRIDLLEYDTEGNSPSRQQVLYLLLSYDVEKMTDVKTAVAILQGNLEIRNLFIRYHDVNGELVGETVLISL